MSKTKTIKKQEIQIARLRGLVSEARDVAGAARAQLAAAAAPPPPAALVAPAPPPDPMAERLNAFDGLDRDRRTIALALDDGTLHNALLQRAEARRSGAA